MAPKNVGTLAAEIRQKKPFRSVRHEAFLGLLRTTEIVRNFTIEEVGLEDITLPQYNVLRILRGSGPAGLPTLEVAARLVEKTPGVTRLITRLEDKGLVRRERSTADRRVVYCKLTPAGASLLKNYDSKVDAANAAALGMLSEQDLRRLVRLLDKVRAAHGSVGGHGPTVADRPLNRS